MKEWDNTMKQLNDSKRWLEESRRMKMADPTKQLGKE